MLAKFARHNMNGGVIQRKDNIAIEGFSAEYQNLIKRQLVLN